jgi:hypothetical protein
MPDLDENRDVLFLKKAIAGDNLIYKKSDMDEDSVPDETDNCVQIINPKQEDLNGNGRGDVCDDFDRDGVINIDDNCRDVPNQNQKDVDLDGVGDVCDEKENRVLQNQKWLPLALILIVAGIIGGLFVRILRHK